MHSREARALLAALQIIIGGEWLISGGDTPPPSPSKA
jgi:hypothetical protein